MLGQIERYVNRVSQYWNEAPSRDILEYSEYLLDLFPRFSDRAAFTSGMVRMALLSENPTYKQIATACFDSTKTNTAFDIFCIPIWVPPEDGGKSLEVSIREAGVITKKEHAEEHTVGLLHGHYRALTPGNLAHIIMAKRHSDTLLLGLESGRRSKIHKEVEQVYPDWERRRIMLGSRLADYVVMISRLEYSNAGYERMIDAIRPDVYFGNEGDPAWLRDAMRVRAERVGADYHELPQVQSFSTSDYVNRNIQIPVI